MARPTRTLVDALRATALRLEQGSRFRWTHMGACNCGHLAQTVTARSRAEIHRIAVEKTGDWHDHAIEWCPASGYPIDHVIEEMLSIGLELSDVENLERLRDPAVLRRLPLSERRLDYRDRGDAIRYMRAWADQLEDALEPVDDVTRSGVRRLEGKRRAG